MFVLDKTEKFPNLYELKICSVNFLGLAEKLSKDYFDVQNATYEKSLFLKLNMIFFLLFLYYNYHINKITTYALLSTHSFTSP